ncbi:hypothetical protein INR49_026455 [Caranx melampygus]|nr:hypothetical protein INR49_026455 [Caranx melampygus]
MDLPVRHIGAIETVLPSLHDARLGVWTCRCAHPPASLLLLLARFVLSLVETDRKRGRELGSSDLSSSGTPANSSKSVLDRT